MKNMFNSSYGYGWISILIHWVSFIVASVVFGFGLYMVELTYYDSLYTILPEWHKALGLLIGVLTLLRLAWMRVTVKPHFLGDSKWQALFASLAHLALYLSLLLLVVTGYFIVTADGRGLQLFGQTWLSAVTVLDSDQAEWVGKWHRWIAYGFGGLVVGHASAALYHHFFHRDNTLKRMLFPISNSNGD